MRFSAVLGAAALVATGSAASYKDWAEAEISLAGAGDDSDDSGDSDDFDGPNGNVDGEISCVVPAQVAAAREGEADGTMFDIALTFDGRFNFTGMVALSNNAKMTHSDESDTTGYVSVNSDVTFQSSGAPVQIHSNGKHVKDPNLWFVLTEGACPSGSLTCPTRADAIQWTNLGKCKNNHIKPKKFKAKFPARASLTLSKGVQQCTGQGPDDATGGEPKEANEIFLHTTQSVTPDETCAWLVWTTQPGGAADCDVSEDDYISFNLAENNQQIFRKHNSMGDGVGGNPWIWLKAGPGDSWGEPVGRCNDQFKEPNENDPAIAKVETVSTTSGHNTGAAYAAGAAAFFGLAAAVYKKRQPVKATKEERSAILRV